MSRTRQVSQYVLLLVALVFVVSSGRRVTNISELQHRIKTSQGFAAYSAADQQLIRSGKSRPGLDEYALWLSRGDPTFYWHTLMGKKWCRVLLFGEGGGALISLAVYTCGAMVVHAARIQPALPCWRLKKVAVRAKESLSYFERRPLTRQWEIITGLIRRKQTAKDLAIMLGKPHNTGVDAREDGTNAATQVYLDSTGDSYGLHVTLIQGLVAGWKIPAARQMTPEAQQRRLQATEQRLMAKMRQIEQRSIKRHREEMSLMSNIQTNQAQMMQPLVEEAKSLITKRLLRFVPKGIRGPVGGIGRRVVRSRKTLTINGCTYKDNTPNGELGRVCGTAANPGCGSGYTCLVTIGTTGLCVPSGQRCTRKR